MSRRAGTRRRILITAAIVAVVLASIGVEAWRRSRLAPEWWAPPDRTAAAVHETAETVEYRLVEEAHRIRPIDEAWAVRITDAQINAWLAARLDEWIAHRGDLRWPDDLGMPQVHFADDLMTVAIEFNDGGRPGYAVADFTLAIADDGVRIMLAGVGLGRLRLPGAPITRLLDELAPRMSERFRTDPIVVETIDVLSGRRSFEPRVVLADDRVVRITAVHIEAGAAVLACRTGTDTDTITAASRPDDARTPAGPSGPSKSKKKKD